MTVRFSQANWAACAPFAVLLMGTTNAGIGEDAGAGTAFSVIRELETP